MSNFCLVTCKLVAKGLEGEEHSERRSGHNVRYRGQSLLLGLLKVFPIAAMVITQRVSVQIYRLLEAFLALFRVVFCIFFFT